MNYNKYLEYIFYLSLAIGFYFQMQHLTTPLLDQYGFRQTQTAITSYWFIKEGFQFAYQTPVFGFPWSIPMEFPIYQYLVYIFSKISRIDNLDFIGRIVSLFFYYALLYPFSQILKSLEVSKTTILYILILLVTSPIYIFWSRTFMIESTGLYFTLMFVMYLIKYDKEEYSSYKLLTFIFIFGTFAVLSKITTLFVGLVFLFLYISFFNRIKSLFTEKGMKAIFIVGIVIFIGFSWNEFADKIKEVNPLSEFLVSSNLSKWNFGTLDQRLDVTNYVLIIKHMIHNNSFLLFLLLFIPSVFFCNLKYKKIIIISFLTYSISFMTFFNLYKVHSYYWYANSIFLVIILGVIISLINEKLKNYIWKNLLVAIIIFINIYGYKIYYYETQINDFTKNKEVFIGDIVKKFTLNESILLTVGLDWDSSLPYYSERKAMMIRGNDSLINNKFQNVYSETIKFNQVGAVVICGVKSGYDELFKLVNIKDFDYINYDDCDIYVNNIQKYNILEYMTEKQLTKEEILFFSKKDTMNHYNIKLENFDLINGKQENEEYKALNNDMYLVFKSSNVCKNKMGIEININRSNSGYSQLFYKKDGEQFSEENSIKKFFSKGKILMKFVVEDSNISSFRFDPTEKIENVKIDGVKVYCQ